MCVKYFYTVNAQLLKLFIKIALKRIYLIYNDGVKKNLHKYLTMFHRVNFCTNIFRT